MKSECGHDWDEWSIKAQGKLQDFFGNFCGYWILQQRTCNTCGKTELDSIKKDLR